MRWRQFARVAAVTISLTFVFGVALYILVRLIIFD
jgi:hypothetical protein